MNEEINEGDLVLCVDDSIGADGQPIGLKNGNKYVVNALVKCSCGCFGIDVGVPMNSKTGLFRCPKCEARFAASYPNQSSFNPKRFRKLPPPAKEIRIVEIASDLREEVRELVNDVLVKERRDV